MDIANYLSELLGQHGEVSVPGLGFFVRLRINGYYNEEESTFYPPHYQIQFDPQSIDDDLLANYIAEKKKISQASSKYFTEKYITNLKQQAAKQEVPFADLGWFYAGNGKISFRANDKFGDDASFFGYAPINVNKPTQERAFVPVNPVQAPEPEPAPAIIQPAVKAEIPAPAQPIAPPVAPPAPVKEPEPVVQAESVEWRPSYTEPDYSAGTIKVVSDPVQTADQPEYVDDEPQVKRGVQAWVIMLIIILALGAAFLGIYKFKPELFKKWQHKPASTKIAAAPVNKPDTDTSQNAPVPIDTKTPDTAALNTKKAISAPDSALTKTKPAEKPVIKAEAVKPPAPKPVVTKPAEKQTANKPVVVKTVPAATTPAITNTPVNKPTATNGPVLNTANITKTAYLIYTDSFETMTKAEQAVKDYKVKGVTAKILTGPGTGKLSKVILGPFDTYDDAQTEMFKLIGEGKINKYSYTQTINPNK